MPSFSFSNPLTGRKVTSPATSEPPSHVNGGKAHKSKLSNSPAVPVSSSHPSSSRLDKTLAGVERQSSNAAFYARQSMSASSSTQDVRLASFNSGPMSVAAVGRKNIAGLTGEQKIVTVLINRLVSKLPATTGSNLGATEADPIVQQTIAALETLSETKIALVANGLTAVLEGFIPQTANLALANVPVHVLQSQYLILKALQHCTTAYWKYHHERNPTTPGHPFRPELRGYPQTWPSPPSIDENLARFMVNILLLYVRMTTYEVTAVQPGARGRTAPVPGTFGIKGENDQTPMGRSMLRFLHGFSTSADLGLKYRTEKGMEGKDDSEGPGGLMIASDGTEAISPPLSPGLNKSPRLGQCRPQSIHSVSSVASRSGSASASSLMCEIARQAGKVFYFLSSASWNVVHGKIKSTLVKLAQSNQDHPDAVEIRMLEWVNLDQAKLSLIIKDFAMYFSHIRRSVHSALAVAVHSAIWNWIEAYPADFILLHQKSKRIDSGAESLFDVVHSISSAGDSPSKAKAYWPTLAALLLLCPDILDKATHGEAGSSATKKAIGFLDTLRKSGKASSVDEPTLLCYVDFCKAGSIIPLGNHRYALHDHIQDVRADFQERLLHDDSLMELLDINLLICGFVALHRSRFLDSRAWSPMLAFLKEGRSLRCRKVIAHSTLILILESDNQPHAPPLVELQNAAAPFFRAWLTECIGHWTSDSNWKPTYFVDLNIFDSPTYMAREKMLLDAILKVYAAQPAFAFDDAGNGTSSLGVSTLLTCLSKAAFHLRSPETARDCERCLLALQSWIFASSGAEAEEYQLAVSLVSARLLHEACRFVGQSLYTSGQDKDHARMIYRLVEQAILTAKAGRLLASRRHTADLWHDLAKSEMLVDIILVTSLLSPDFEMNARTIKSLGLLAKYRLDTAQSVDRDMKIMRESVSSVFEHMHENLQGIFGKIQQQNLIRNAFKSFAQPCAAARTLWQLLFSRFAALTTRIVDSVELRMAADRHEGIPSLNSYESGLWKNLGLFLASTSDVCCAINQMIEVPQEWVPEDRAVGTVPEFVETLVDLFVADSEQVRESTKQVAGEISIRHLNLLINQIRSLMEHSFTDGRVNRSDPFDYLVATSMGTLRVLMQRDLEEKFSSDLAQNPDFGSLICLLAEYVNVLPFGPIAHRCKLELGRIVTRIGDKLAAEPVKRERLFANIQSWTSQALKEAGHSSFRDLSHIQQCEDDVILLNGLVQLSAAMSEDNMTEKQAYCSTKTLSDAEFYGRFIQRINQETAEHRSVYAFRMMEQAQAVLNNLIAANGNDCLGQCLEMTMSQKAGLRYPFLQAMTVILKEKTTKNLVLKRRKSDSVSRPFTKTLMQRNHILVQAIASTAMLQDIDILAAVLYRIYIREGGVYSLLHGLLEQEVRSTENQLQLFRTNSIVTRVITQHVRKSGFAYFRNLLLPTVAAVSEIKHETEQEDITALVIDLLNRIVKIQDVPSSLRHTFHLVSTATLCKFEASRHAVSSFFFLRVLCPALVSPERFDIIVEDDRGRLLLLKMGKILLNIANVQAFGAKDPQLAVYNDLLAAKYQEIVDFLTELGASWPEPASSLNSPEKTLIRSDADVDEEFIAFYVIEHLSEIVQVNGIDVAHLQTITRSVQQRYTRRIKTNASTQASAYTEFMKRSPGRSPAHEKVFFRGHASSNESREVFYLILGSGQVAFNDAFLWHILKTLEGCGDFDLVLDLTRSNSTQTPRMTFLEKLLELCPKTLNKLKTIVLFQPNLESPRLLMNAYMLFRVLGVTSSARIFAAATLSQLIEHVPMASMRLSRETLVVSEAAKVTQEDVSYEVNDGRLLPVTIAFKNNIFVLQTTAKQELLPFDGVSSELVAVFSVGDFDDSVQSRLRGQGSEAVIQQFKETRKTSMAGFRRKYELRENKGQSSVAVAVLASALFNLVATNSTKTQRAAVDLLRAGENCFQFGLGGYTPKYEDVQTFSSSVATASKVGSRLIKLVPHLCLGMSLEFLKALGHIDGEHRLSLISLSTPWFEQCVEVVQPFNSTYVANMASMREIAKSLIELTISQEEHWSAWLEPLWRALSHAPDDIMDMILGEMLSVLQESAIGINAWQGLQAALRSFSANGLLVKLASRLRKKIAATYTNTCPALTDSAAWPEISSLLQATFLRISASIPQSDLFVALPDIIYALIMTAGLGSEKVRTCAHSLACRVIELCIEEKPDVTSDLTLEAQSEAILDCYGLVPSKTPDSPYVMVAKTEKLCAFLLSVLAHSAPSLDLQNVWLARLQSLWTSNSFQYNPAVQQRALVALGTLISGARPGEVEDDFMYQLLVAIHNTLAQPVSPVSDMLLISMLRCLTHVISGVSLESRYGGASTFWLGLGILQTGRLPLISAAIDLLVAALKQAEKTGLVEAGIQQLFLAHRPRDVAVLKLDAYTGVDFESEITFTFSVAALVYRGMRLEATRVATKEVFGLLMTPGLKNRNTQLGFVPPQCLAYFLCRYSVKNNNAERRSLVELTCGKGTFDRVANHANVFPLLDIPDSPTAIMVIALLFGMLRAAELEHERVMLLTTLAEAARQLPEIMAIWQTHVHTELVNYLLHSSNPQILLAVNSILTVVGHSSARDELADNASRVSKDTKTSADSDLDAIATLRDLKMACLHYMGAFRFDNDKMANISVLVSQLVAP